MIETYRLKEVRLKFNKSQQEVANLLKVSRTSYAMWESNNELVPIKRLIDFCQIFNVSIDYVLALNSDLSYLLSHYNKVKSIQRLKEFRKENHLTQEKLACILHTNKSVVCNYEKGRYIIATPFLYQICKTFHVSADYLLGKIDFPKYL